jgi:hypothetical protein
VFSAFYQHPLLLLIKFEGFAASPAAPVIDMSPLLMQIFLMMLASGRAGSCMFVR